MLKRHLRPAGRTCMPDRRRCRRVGLSGGELEGVSRPRQPFGPPEHYQGFGVEHNLRLDILHNLDQFRPIFPQIWLSQGTSRAASGQHRTMLPKAGQKLNHALTNSKSPNESSTVGPTSAAIARIWPNLDTFGQHRTNFGL